MSKQRFIRDKTFRIEVATITTPDFLVEVELATGNENSGARLQPFGADTDGFEDFAAYHDAVFVAETFVENAVEH